MYKPKWNNYTDKFEWLKSIKFKHGVDLSEFNQSQIESIRNWLNLFETKPDYSILANVLKVCVRYKDDTNITGKINEYFELKKTKDPIKLMEFLNGAAAVEQYNIIKRKNNYSKPRSKYTLEYWLYRGHSKEGAEEKVKEFKSYMSTRFKPKSTGYIEYRDNPYSLSFWMYRGYSKEESVIKINEHLRKTDTSLESFIEKHGIEVGIKKYNDKLAKRKQTMSEKPACEFNYSKASKMSLKIFIPLYKQLRRLGVDRKFIHLGVKGSREYVINTGENVYFYDFTIKNVKIICEFNGLMYHVRDLSSFKSPFVKNPLKKIESDDAKRRAAESAGFKYFVIWEDEDPKIVVQSIVQLVKGYYENK